MPDTIGFLLSDVSRLLRRAFDARARTIGVTRAQWRTLLVLSRNEGSNQGRLADALDVEPITLCRMIDRLVEADLVERRRDPSDRRAWRIHLTDRARPLLTQLRTMGDALFAEALRTVPDTDRATLIATLQTMHSNLSSIDDEAETANG